MRIAAIILGAGSSRRLGTPKQLVTFDGVSLIRRAARAACDSGADPVIAVLGFDAPRMQREIEGLTLRIAINGDWSEGIASSIRCGITALGEGCDAALLAVCDQPHISGAHLKTLLDAARDAPGRAVASTYGGTAGVPAVLPRSLFSGLLALRGDRGAQKILSSQGAALITVPWPEGAIDVDSAEDAPASL